MDSAFSLFDPNWFFNAWGGADTGSFIASRETRPAYVHSGTSSQKFQVIDKKGGEVQLISPYAFTNGKTYHVTAYLRSDEATPVQFLLRKDAHPWQPVASATVTLTPAWQKIDIEGTFDLDVPGSVRVALLNATGTVWIDDVTVSEVVRNDLAPATSAPVPDTMFGMHVNRLGVHAKWPGMGTKIVRLWDTGTTWRDLKPAPGAWDFSLPAGQRLDMYVDYVLRNDPQAGILYTLGQTPAWAARSPSPDAIYGPGAASPPRDMNDWRDYVRTLARRYVGRIRYWELWNEADYAMLFNGSYGDLAEMARIAREELLAIDPGNKLVSPGFTQGQGMAGLESFLNAGGGQYVDMIGFHWYYTANPEALVSGIDNVRNLLKAHGLGDKPLWNTEAAFICDATLVPCTGGQPTPEQSRSVNARAMFLMADKGVQNFNYYFWETDAPTARLVETDLVTQTPAGLALTEARTWIKGASIVDGYRIDDKVYVLRMTRGSQSFVVLWSTQPGTLVNLPAGWNARIARTLTGVESIIANAQLTVGIEPLLLKP
jgi:hypothetical protein